MSSSLVCPRCRDLKRFCRCPPAQPPQSTFSSSFMVSSSSRSARVSSCCSSLVIMGFPPSESFLASEKFHGDVTAASEFLIAQGEKENRGKNKIPLEPMMIQVPQTIETGLSNAPVSRLEVSTFLSSRPLPASLAPSARAALVDSFRCGEFPLRISTFLDVRDALGKWLEGEIVDVKFSLNLPNPEIPQAGPSVPQEFEFLWLRIHYLEWESKWDEFIHCVNDCHRFAPYRKFSGEKEIASLPEWFKPDSAVAVFLIEKSAKNSPAGDFPQVRGTWGIGKIRKLDHGQCQVEAATKEKIVQRWFHWQSDWILPIEKIQQEIRQTNKQTTIQKQGNHQSIENSHTPQPSISPPLHRPSPPQPGLFPGEIVEVLDSTGSWLPAEILTVEAHRFSVHFVNWSSRWDIWLSRPNDSYRVRSLGSALVDSPAAELRKAEDEQFRRRLEEFHGFLIVDSERDGNCLFRSWAHQIYGDFQRHLEVRQACYHYMAENQPFFSQYIGEDFSSYLTRQRQPGEWGDHIEIIALRELFNKNVEIFSSDCVKGPQPLGLGMEIEGKWKIPIVRLAYHGKNHYNSLVDKKQPPPLGDGKDSPISMRELRKAQEKVEKQREEEKKLEQKIAQIDIGKTRENSISITRTKSSHSLLRETRLRSSDNPLSPASSASSATSPNGEFGWAQLKAIWNTFDHQQRGIIPESLLFPLLQSIVERIYHWRLEFFRSSAAPLEAERLNKAFDELKEEIQEIAAEMARKIRLAKENDPFHGIGVGINGSRGGGKLTPLSAQKDSGEFAKNFSTPAVPTSRIQAPSKPLPGIVPSAALTASSLLSESQQLDMVSFQQFSSVFFASVLPSLEWAMSK